MDDMPRIPSPPIADGVPTKVTPVCSVCGTAVPDLTDPKHHVCVSDGAGGFTKTTRDVAAHDWQTKEDAFRAAEKAKK
jgi:hypothetical protein